MDSILQKCFDSQQKQINNTPFKSSLSQYVFIGKIKINKQFAFFIGVSSKILGLPGSRHNKKKIGIPSENDQYNFSQYFNLTSSDINFLNSSQNSDIDSSSLFRITYLQFCYDEFSLQRSTELTLWNHGKSIATVALFNDLFYCDFQTIQQLCIWYGTVQDFILNDQNSSILSKISNIVQFFQNS